MKYNMNFEPQSTTKPLVEQLLDIGILNCRWPVVYEVSVEAVKWHIDFGYQKGLLATESDDDWPLICMLLALVRLAEYADATRPDFRDMMKMEIELFLRRSMAELACDNYHSTGEYENFNRLTEDDRSVIYRYIASHPLYSAAKRKTDALLLKSWTARP